MKKKFFSSDIEVIPYLKPIVFGNNRIVHGEDEDYLLDIIGKQSWRLVNGVMVDYTGFR